MTQAQATTPTGGMTAEVQEEIIRTALRSYERLPVFEVIMDRAVQALGPALRSSMHVQAEVALQGVDYMSCGDALALVPDPGLVALATAKPWDGPLAVAVDPALLFSVLEIMLGAPDATDTHAGKRPGPAEPAWQPRAFTTIEKRLGGALVALVLREVATAFAPLDSVYFNAGTIESGPRDVLLAPASASCVRVRIRVTLNGRTGGLCLIVPHQTLGAVRPMLAQPRTSGQLGEDQGWKAQLTQSLNETPVTLTAVLHERELPLADVLGWRTGQVLDLCIDTADEVTVTCSGKDMFRAAIGRRKNGAVALRLTAELDGNEEESANGTSD